jgi:hypothetical protein
MKKTIYFITTILLSAAMLSLSSCLKDQYVDFTKDAPVVNFPLGGTQYFGADAITEAPDTDANGTIVRQFAVNVGATKASSTATTITLAIDNSIVTAYNASQTAVSYLPMPANAFVFTATTVTVPAGEQYATVSVTFYKNKLNPALSYMLPIKIVSAGGVTVSGNQNIHYYHFIGNDFAGAYLQNYTRYNASDSTSAPVNANSFTGAAVTFVPVSPTQFEMPSGYAGGAFRLEVSFDKTGTGAAATYSNFNVFLNAADVAALAPAPNFLTVGQTPVFLPSGNSSLPGPYTFAQALKILRFQWIALSSGAPRYNIDKYYKP